MIKTQISFLEINCVTIGWVQNAWVIVWIFEINVEKTVWLKKCKENEEFKIRLVYSKTIIKDEVLRYKRKLVGPIREKNFRVEK